MPELPTSGDYVEANAQRNGALDDSEHHQPARKAIEGAVRTILDNIGEDSGRQGLRDTPERVARMYAEVFSGYSVDVDEMVNNALFPVAYNEPVIVRDITFYSMCEHHMLPFYGKAHVAYIPKGKVIGLSKIPRIVEMYARRLQIQERMTGAIAEQLAALLDPEGVAVIVEGLHMCAVMRGVKKEGASMITSAYLGRFQHDKEARRELLTLLQGSGAELG